MAKNIPLTEFDQITLNPMTQIIKAVIPFLDVPLQRTFSFIVRFTEFQQTIHFFNNFKGHNPFSSVYSSCTSTPIRSLNDILSNEEILNSILKYCPDNYASMINMYRQFTKMSEMMNNPMFSNLMSGLGSMDNFGQSDFMNNFSQMDLSSIFGQQQEPSKTSENHKDIHSDTHNDKLNETSDMSMFNNIMNSEQQKMYEQYLEQLNNLNFDEGEQ